ncbi:MAG TPA: class I SAM-dependent methyltransferase [Thermoplasmata archaeon]|nr:class I SAM-dependent methyltransferase [Thermoplasmata archaeon]
MSEMNVVARFFINLGNSRRSARLLRRLRSAGPIPWAGRILELGAGQGGLSALLHATYRPKQVTVTDFDPRQVDAARALLVRRFGAVPSSMELRAVDARSLPFEDGAFDIVLAILMLHHVEERHGEYRQRPGALREIRRVLAPGGLLIYSDFSRTAEMRETLGQLGFTAMFRRPGWRHHELAVFRAPESDPPLAARPTPAEIEGTVAANHGPVPSPR